MGPNEVADDLGNLIVTTNYALLMCAAKEVAGALGNLESQQAMPYSCVRQKKWLVLLATWSSLGVGCQARSDIAMVGLMVP